MRSGGGTECTAGRAANGSSSEAGISLRVIGSLAGLLSRRGAGRHELGEPVGGSARPPEAAGHLSLPTDSVLRADSPSKIIKLDTVRLIAEKVSRALLWVSSHLMDWETEAPEPNLSPTPDSSNVVSHRAPLGGFVTRGVGREEPAQGPSNKPWGQAERFTLGLWFPRHWERLESTLTTDFISISLGFFWPVSDTLAPGVSLLSVPLSFSPCPLCPLRAWPRTSMHSWT